MKSTITRSGQTTVPAALRRRRGWPANTVVDWQEEGDRVYVAKLEPKEPTIIRLRRVGGKLRLPRGLKVDMAALARDIRADRDAQ